MTDVTEEFEEGSFPEPNGDGRWIFKLHPDTVWFTAHIEGRRIWANLLTPDCRGKEQTRPLGYKWRRPTDREWEIGESDGMGRVSAVELHAGYNITRQLGLEPAPKWEGWVWFRESFREGKPENRLPDTVFDLIGEGSSSWMFRSAESALAVADAAAWEGIWTGKYKPLGYI